MAVCLAAASLEPVLGRPMPPSQPRPAAQTQAVGGLQLRVRRLPDAVELVLQEAGLGATLTQQPFADRWQGELRTDRPRALQVGPQALALPAEGLEQIRFEGSGTSFRLTVLPTPGRLLGSPVVSSDGRDLVVRFPAAPQSQSLTWMPNLNRPTPVPTQTFVPPLRPRAVAPPVGDMAVGTMTVMSRGFLNLNGPPVTLSTRRANAADVLMLLAEMGGYGFAVVPDSKSCALGVAKEQGQMMLDVASEDSSKQIVPLITLAFRGESYSRAFNAALRSAGWYGVKEGSTIFAGRSVVCDSLGQQVTKVIRLNQADPEAAVSYLATLGALGKRPNQTTVLTTSGPTAERQPGQENKQQETSLLEIELYRSPAGPLLGLEASFDKRLGLVTLTGSPSVVTIAEQYLRKFDLRRRQVALSVAILDIDLNSDTSLASSFAYRSGQNFIVNDAGRLFANFGETGQESPFNIPDGDIVGFLRAQISSQNAKVLASPTLILQEGGSSVPVVIQSSGQQKDRSRIVGAEVNIGAEVITEFSVSTDSLGNNVCTPTTKTAGLSLRASVDKIDDNGFVTFSVNPSISAPVGNQLVPGCGTINILNQRTLAGSNSRVRDGQTLILTGVISDEDRTVATKWPILGDIPLIGSLFRSTGRTRVKRELVILVTPRIVSDEEGGLFGYGYRPASNHALRLISEPAMN
jgi:type IV pilus assembly protein PilQ